MQVARPPVSGKALRQPLPQHILKNSSGIGGHAVAEKTEQRRMVGSLKKRNFEFQQGILPGIHIHTMDHFRVIQQVIQRVATGAGQHHHPAVGAKFEQLPVAARVFPARIVH